LFTIDWVLVRNEIRNEAEEEEEEGTVYTAAVAAWNTCSTALRNASYNLSLAMMPPVLDDSEDDEPESESEPVDDDNDRLEALRLSAAGGVGRQASAACS